MNILAIESAAQAASVALLQGDTVTFEFTTNFKKTHSETLLPMIDLLKKTVSLDLSTLDGIAISEGPGSFTGLRIGAATAKGLAFALNKPVIPVSTLEAMAYGLFDADALLCPALDARRSQVYGAVYMFRGEEPVCLSAPECADVADFVKKADALAEETGKKLIFSGDAVKTLGDKIREESHAEVVFAPACVQHQHAGTLAVLGAKKLAEGRTVSAEEFTPVYLRKSQAEQEREEAGLPTE